MSMVVIAAIFDDRLLQISSKNLQLESSCSRYASIEKEIQVTFSAAWANGRQQCNCQVIGRGKEQRGRHGNEFLRIRNGSFGCCNACFGTGVFAGVLATSLGFACAEVYYIACMIREERKGNQLVSLMPNRFSFSAATIGKIVSIGVSGALIKSERN